MQTERLNDVCIMQGGPFYSGSGQLNRLQIGNRCNGPGPSHLIGNRQQMGFNLLGLELISHRPTRALGGGTQIILDGDRIYLDHHPVGCHGKVVPLFIPVMDKLKHFIHVFTGSCVLRDFKAPGCRFLQVFGMGFG